MAEFATSRFEQEEKESTKTGNTGVEGFARKRGTARMFEAKS
ncbi:MAG: hypothetical protein AAGG48_06195 [Planctomycetota bacterium]